MKRGHPRRIRRVLAKYDTRESTVDVTPDLRLVMVETADAYALLDRLVEREAAGHGPVTRLPYWAEVWPAAVALSRWFATAEPDMRPAVGQVLELGCGLGLVGIALAHLGFCVEATDHVADALVFAAHNAQRNGVAGRHRVSYLDWNHPVGTRRSLIVGSDVAYEKGLHPPLRRTLRDLLAPGGSVVLSDPGRPAAQPLFAALARDGLAHRQQRLVVTWGDLRHAVEIHRFDDGRKG